MATHTDVREEEWTAGSNRHFEESENGEPVETAREATGDNFFPSKGKFVPQL